jgi:hypothetical protein
MMDSCNTLRTTLFSSFPSNRCASSTSSGDIPAYWSATAALSWCSNFSLSSMIADLLGQEDWQSMKLSKQTWRNLTLFSGFLGLLRRGLVLYSSEDARPMSLRLRTEGIPPVSPLHYSIITPWRPRTPDRTPQSIVRYSSASRNDEFGSESRSAAEAVATWQACDLAMASKLV